MLQTSPALPHRSISHTVLPVSLLFSVFFFFFAAREDENVAYATCHTGLITTQDYFHRSILSQVYSSYRTIAYIVTTQDYFIHRYQGQNMHASSATKDYLPHRFIACFKATQDFTKR